MVVEGEIYLLRIEGGTDFRSEIHFRPLYATLIIEWSTALAKVCWASVTGLIS